MTNYIQSAEMETEIMLQMQNKDKEYCEWVLHFCKFRVHFLTHKYKYATNGQKTSSHG